MFSNLLIIDILNYIDNNLYIKINIDDLVNRFNYNKDYIMRIFKREIGITIIDYINKKRIFNSLDSLKNSDYSIVLISINYGFSSIEYYSETFSKIMGVPPSVYRKFSRFNYSVSIEEFNSISDNLSNLKYLFDSVERYKNNIIPNNTVKTLSIFTK